MVTLNGSPFLIFFCRNFSKLGGATRTTYGFKSDARSNFKLCGWRFSTQILPLPTTVRMASRDVPEYQKKKKKKKTNIRQLTCLLRKGEKLWVE